jgi:hypothetical protein
MMLCRLVKVNDVSEKLAALLPTNIYSSLTVQTLKMEAGSYYKASLINYQWQWGQIPSDELVFMAYFQVSEK